MGNGENGGYREGFICKEESKIQTITCIKKMDAAEWKSAASIFFDFN